MPTFSYTKGQGCKLKWFPIFKLFPVSLSSLQETVNLIVTISVGFIGYYNNVEYMCNSNNV